MGPTPVRTKIFAASAEVFSWKARMSSLTNDAANSTARPRRLGYVRVAAVGGAVFTLCSLSARSGRVGPVESRVFRAINGLPDGLYPMANVVQQAGALFVPIAVAGVAMVLRRKRIAGSVLLATAAKLGAERLIKLLVVRERPGTTVTGAILRGNVPTGGQSFVSGHAIVVAMLTCVLFAVLPRRWRFAPVAMSAAVVVARVYVGAHSPLDVMGGIAVGLVIGALSCLVLDPVRDVKNVEKGDHMNLRAQLLRVWAKFREHPAGSSPIPNAWGRHPGDVLRVCCASVVLVVTSLIAATRSVNPFEEDLFRLINRLPEFFSAPLNVVMQAGALAAVPVVGVVALLVGRVRLARDVAIGGGTGWVLAKVLKSIVGRQRPFTALEAVFRHTTDGGLGFPSGHATVAAVIATLLGPYLGRHARRFVWAIAVFVGIARVYVGAHLPLDVIGGWALGWLLGSIVHLVFGAPNTVPNADAVRTAVESIVGRTETIRPLTTDARGSVPYVASTAGAKMFAKVVTKQNRDADALYKVARLILYRDLEDEAPFTSPQHAVEHEAYVTLLAERAGAQVAHVCGSARFAHSCVLVSHFVDGAVSLDEFDIGGDAVSVLTDAWRQIALLHAAHIAHRDLRLANVIIGGDALVRIVDFGFAEATASERRLAMDIAEFLVASTLRFGAEQAVTAAVAGIGLSDVATCLPFIQPLALSSSTRSRLRRDHHTLRDLRKVVSTKTNNPEPRLEPLARIKPLTVVMVVALGFGIHLLLPQVGELHTTIKSIRTAQWPWLAGALVASAFTYVFASIALKGGAPVSVPFGRTVVAELASSFANRFVPFASFGVLIRYLQRHGLDGTSSGTTVATVNLAGFTLHVPLLLLAGYAAGLSGISGERLPTGWHILLMVVAVFVVTGIVFATPARNRILAVTSKAAHQLGAVIRDPKRAAQLWLGSLGVTVSYIAAFACSLTAFSAHVPFARLAFVYLAGNAVSALSPTPGGLGAVEAALVAGLTATGVAAGPAIAGVLAFRSATYWLPTIPGWVAFRTLRSHDEL